MPETIRQSYGESTGDVVAHILGVDLVPRTDHEVWLERRAGIFVAGEFIVAFGTVAFTAGTQSFVEFSLPSEMKPLADGRVLLTGGWDDSASSDERCAAGIFVDEDGPYLTMEFEGRQAINADDSIDLNGMILPRG